MNNKDFNLLIVGYGAIGKLVSNISNANLKKTFIYTGRSKVAIGRKDIYSFHGDLSSIFEIELNNLENLKVVYCVGPDKFEGFSRDEFLNYAYHIPTKFLSFLNESSLKKVKFIHLSTMIGFDDEEIQPTTSSRMKVLFNDDPYVEAKKKLDVFIEDFKSSKVSCVNLRLSNLITSDHKTSQRKILLRLAKKISRGEKVSLVEDAHIDIISEIQLLNAVKYEISNEESNISKNVVNQKSFNLCELYDEYIKLHDDNLLSGSYEIIKDNKKKIIPRYMSAYPENKIETVNFFAKELYRLAGN